VKIEAIETCLDMWRQQCQNNSVTSSEAEREIWI
jgi:hypothetical protein